MLINVRTVGVMTIAEAEELIAGMEYPAVLLNDKLFVIKKNRAARRHTNFLKLGCSVVRFLAPESYRPMLDMNPSEMLNVVFDRNGEKYRANTVCGIGCRILIFRSADTGLFAALNDNYSRMSGYDICLSHSPESKNGVLTEGFADIVDDLMQEHTKSHALYFFNAADLVKRFFDELDRQKNGRYIYELLMSGGELFTEGSPKGFLLLLAVMTSLCFDKFDNKIIFSAKNAGSELVFAVYCEKGAAAADAAEREAEQDLFAYGARLIAEANLWELSCFSEGQKRGFVLRTPAVKSGECLALCDEIDAFCALVIGKVLGRAKKVLKSKQK